MRRGNSFPEQGKVEDDRRVIRSWKHPRSVRVAFFLAFVISLTLSLLSAVGLVGKPEVVVADVLVPVFFLFVGALFLALTESSIAMTSQVIRVRNFCRWRVISLDDVISVSPGYYGVAIRYSSNGYILSLASQKSNIASWFKRRTQADEISDEILAAVRSRKGSAASGV